LPFAKKHLSLIILPSANVLQLKTLLRDCWKINSLSLRIGSAPDRERVHVVLEREGKKTHMDVTNDSEFTLYTLHFKKFEDNYGNFEFIYVDDLKEYDRRIDELVKKGLVPKRPYKITIGDVELLNAHLAHLLAAGLGGAHVSVASFFVPLDKNPAFLQVDFRDEVTITWTDSGQTAFKGYAHEVSCGETAAVLLCYGSTRRFFQTRLTSELVAVKPSDSLYFVAMSGGLETAFTGVPRPELSLRSFKVIFPIGGLVIPCNFRIEQVVFTKDIQKELSQTLRNAKTLSKAPWNTVSAFAIASLESRHFLEALTNGEKMVKRAVDWIQFRTDISIPSVKEAGEKRMLSYNMNKSYSKCFLIPYGLAIDSKTGGAIFNLLNIQSGHPLVFNYDPNGFFEPLAPVWEKLQQLGKVSNSNVQPLYEALNWFMQSFEVESLTDNLLQLWMAFEFICSGQKVPPLVQDTNIENCVSSIRAIGLSELEEESIIRNIRQVNDPALMAKWELLLKDLGITLSAQEQRLISRLRTERNRIIHGKSTRKLLIEELEKFRSILERVFIIKTTKLIDSYYAVPDLSSLFS
jgi:hypothetical protein